MYSKFITATNWVPLCGEYKYDSVLDVGSSLQICDGNLNRFNVSFLTNLKGYTNNNYSLLFLTGKSTINQHINVLTPKSERTTVNCLIGNRYVDKKITDNTVFMSVSSTPEQMTVFFSEVDVINNDNFFEFYVTDINECVFFSIKNNEYRYLVVDETTLTVLFLVLPNIKDIDPFKLKRISLFFKLDVNTKQLLLYKKIRGKIYRVTRKNYTVALQDKDIDKNTEDNVFNLISIDEIPKYNLDIDWVSYSVFSNRNNLSINREKSLFDLQNNFLIHNEYNNIVSGDMPVNFITLKNQLTVDDLQGRNIESNNFRDYHTVYGGGDREDGYDNISLGYTSKYYSLRLAKDKTTWFHIPYNPVERKIININDSPFVINGATPGLTPMSSDKIWKRSAGYKTSTSNGESSNTEHTGQWLCAWLSGYSDDAVWVNRFYNPDKASTFNALRYNTNAFYTSMDSVKYTIDGVHDYISDMVLEEGCWYAYSRVGVSTAKQAIKSITDNTEVYGLDTYRNKDSYNNINTPADVDGEPVYAFNGQEYGSVDVKKMQTSNNNFTLSFFAKRDNWDVKTGHQILGNYIDSGFGIFNNIGINALLFYFNKTKVWAFNYKLNNIFVIDILEVLKATQYANNVLNNIQNDYIIDVFYIGITDNFYVVFSSGYVFELNCEGTILDVINIQQATPNSVSKVVSVTHNLTNCAIILNDTRVLQFNFLTKQVSYPSSSKIFYIDKYTNSNKETIQLSNDTYNILFDINENIYIVYGNLPIFKNGNIYFFAKSINAICVYDTSNEETLIYKQYSQSNKILNYNFDLNENTYVLFATGYNIYDEKGILIEDKSYPVTSSGALTGLSVGFQDLGKKTSTVFVLADTLRHLYFYNIEDNKLQKIERESNTVWAPDTFLECDFSNHNFNQSIMSNLNTEPSYTFKLKLVNAVNLRDSLILNISILADYLTLGFQHFVIQLDTIKGLYTVFLNGVKFRELTFTPGKYIFSRLFKNNIVVGTTSFYSGIPYNIFYRDDDILYIDDLVLEKIRLFDKVLTLDDVKYLYFEKYPPGDLLVDLDIGKRNYIDVVSRIFKHKKPGFKTNILNININDSLIEDKELQDYYNILIQESLEQIIPASTKINNIAWGNNKINSEKIIEGSFNSINVVKNFKI